MRLLILGGTGASGKALICRMRGEQAASTDITVVSRTATELSGADRVLTGHYGQILGSAEFSAELARFDAVVHLGDGLGILQQRVHAANTAEADRLVGATESVAAALRAAQVPLFVYVSSIKALCDEDDDRILVETSEPRSTTLYGRSKLRLEQKIAAIMAGSATRLVVLRNPVMYGGGKGGSIGRLIGLADSPLPLPLAGIDNRRSLLAIENFAGALAAVVRSGRNAPPGVFHVHDGPPLSTTEIVTTLRAALGRPLRLFPMGKAGAHAARRMPLLAPAARRLFGSLELSGALFRQSFDWAPALSTSVALTGAATQARTRRSASGR